MKSWMVLSSLVLFILVIPSLLAADEKTLEQRRRDTIQYGTDTEVLELVKAIDAEKVDIFNDDLLKIIEKTKNPGIIESIFTFLGERNVSSAEDRAIRTIEERDQEQNSSVRAAIAYLGKIKSEKASSVLQKLLTDKEKGFADDCIRALGKCGKAPDVDFLISYAKELDSDDQLHYVIIASLGEIGSKQATQYLNELIDNTELKPAKRIAILEAMGKIADEASLESVLGSLSDSDANVRATAIAALGPYSGDKVDSAILEAFRDSFYKTRLAAAKSAGKRRLAPAVPFLRYRASFDDVPAVREESIRALGLIGNGDAMDVVMELFKDKKSTDSLRIVAAAVLLEKDPGSATAEIVLALDEAKTGKRTAFYNGLAKALSSTKASSLEDLAKRFLSSGDVIDKHYGLDLVILNKFGSLESLVSPLATEKNEALAAKAKKALDAISILPH